MVKPTNQELADLAASHGLDAVYEKGRNDAMTRPVSEEREKAEEAARRLIERLETLPLSTFEWDDDIIVARALLSTSDDLAKANECWRKSRQYNDTLRRELDVARAAERGMRVALEKAAAQFEFYAREHRNKAAALPGTATTYSAYLAAHAKADTNEKFATMCRAAIADRAVK